MWKAALWFDPVTMQKGMFFEGKIILIGRFSIYPDDILVKLASLCS